MSGEGAEAIILFIDIVDSVPLYERSGDRGALRMIASALDDMELIVHRNGGRVIRSKGDDLLCTFDSPVDALDAATDILAAFNQFDTPVRMGMHRGPVIEARGDIFGDAVNVAARMLGMAKPGEMLCTEALALLIPEQRRQGLTPLGRRAVKGKEDAIPIYSMVQDDGESTLLVDADTVIEKALGMQAETEVVLQHANRRWCLRCGEPDLHIGRAERCDIQIAEGSVSREHATIRVTPGQISLTDHSTAGSWVCVAGQPITPLKRGTLALTGEGVICFGAPPKGERQPARLGFSVRGVEGARFAGATASGVHRSGLQARAAQRTVTVPFPVVVGGSHGAVPVAVKVADLSLRGAKLLADQCLGAIGEILTLSVDAAAAPLECNVRYGFEVAGKGWSHGIMFNGLTPDGLHAIKALLEERAESA